jgi:hypothetical protein
MISHIHKGQTGSVRPTSEHALSNAFQRSRNRACSAGICRNAKSRHPRRGSIFVGANLS